jgi:hypothetical protein
MTSLLDETHRSAILLAVSSEQDRQEALLAGGKFPWASSTVGRPHAEKLAVLSEEVGEVAKEVVEHLITYGKYTAERREMPPHRVEHYRRRIREELVQVAAVAVGWIEALDEESRIFGGGGGNEK